MKEIAVPIGCDPQLVGILTPAEYPDKKRPMVLLLNSGLLNRTGPFRLHVSLARKLATIGFDTFRFDLSGIGDSDRADGQLSIDEQHLTDIKNVMSFLAQEEKVKEFVVAGICTGADYAHKIMLMDQRVKAAVCIDGYTYPTFRYYLNYYLPRLFNSRIWLNKLKKLTSRSPVSEANHSEDSIARLYFRWGVPPKDKTGEDYRWIIDQNLKMLCVFTASWPYNYKNQLADAFANLDFGNSIRLEFLDNVEHTYPMLKDRERLIKVVVNWFETEMASY